MMGEAGLGKSRLVTEVKEQVDGDVQWFEGRAYSYETQTPYAPFLRLLAACTGVHSEDDESTAATRVRDRATESLGARAPEVVPYLLTLLKLPVADAERELVAFVDPPLLRERIVGALLEYLSALSARAPLVVVLEDLHWADPTSVDLLGRLLPLVERSPLLLVAVYRPGAEGAAGDFHQRATGEFAARHTAVELRPLDEGQSRLLVANLLEIEGLPERIRQLILDKSEGNPFFVEEVIRSLLDAGVVVRDGPYWKATREIEDLAVPDTLVSVLTTRLDLLDDETKLVACTAAVVGRSFDADTVAAIAEGGPDVRAALETLQQRGLVRETGARTFAFKHALTQQTAYEASLLSARRSLHRRLGERIEATEPERVFDLARHFVEAREHGRALPHLVAAGRQAARSFSLAEAIGYFRKAVELFGADDDVELAKQAYEGLIECLGFSADPGLMDVLADAVALADARAHVPTKVMALNKQALFMVLGTGDTDTATVLLEESQEQAQRAGDLAGLAEMHTTYCMLNVCAGKLDKANAHLAEAINVGVELGSDMAQAFARTHHAHTLLYLTKFDEAAVAIDRAIAFAEGSGQLPFLAELKSDVCSTLLLYRGDLPAARRSAVEGLELAQRIGSLQNACNAALSAATYATAMGEWEAAREEATLAFEVAGQMGMAFFQVPVAACLAVATYALDPGDTDTVAHYERTCLELFDATHRPLVRRGGTRRSRIPGAGPGRR